MLFSEKNFFKRKKKGKIKFNPERRLILGGALAYGATKILGINNEVFAQQKDEYIRPFPGRTVQLSEAKELFTMFPDQIKIKTNKRVILVSRKWQIGCVYDASGKILIKDGENYCFQVGTGMLDEKRNTKLGVYQIGKKEPENYTSFGTSDGLAKGAPMPHAMKLHKFFLKNGQVKPFEYQGDSLHARPSTITNSSLEPFKSLGCLGVNLKKAEELNKENIVESGDLVVIVDDLDFMNDSYDLASLVAELDKKESDTDFVKNTLEYKNDYMNQLQEKNMKKILKDPVNEMDLPARSPSEFSNANEYMEYIRRRSEYQRKNR